MEINYTFRKYLIKPFKSFDEKKSAFDISCYGILKTKNKTKKIKKDIITIKVRYFFT